MNDEPRMAELQRKLVSLYDIYGAKLLRKSCLSIRGGAGVIETLLGDGKFHRALEIGTFRGVGAAALSLYVDQVITIDLAYGQLERMGERFDRVSFWEKLGRDNITQILVHDEEEKATVIRDLEFDFAFVDGAHDQTVAYDFSLVKRCGHVLFHDYDRRGSPEKDQVADFVDSLPKSQVTKMDIFAYWQAP